MRCLYVASHPADEGPGWDANPGLSEPRAHVFNHNTPYCLQSHEQLQGHQPFAKPVLKFCRDQGICSLHFPCNQFSSVQFSHSVVSNFATPWTAAHQASLSITNSGVHPNPCPLTPWCHPTISSSVVPFSSCPQSFPASGSLQMSQLFTSGGQSIGVSASMNTQDWSPLGWTGWISFAVQGTLKSLLQHHSSKASILWHSAFFIVQLSHPYMTTGKTISLTRWTFVDKLMSLLFNMLSMLVITFLPRSKHLLISCLQSPSAVILEAPK